MANFKRARQTDQKNARRQSLLDAATALFDAGGPTGAGINAIAVRAGFTKSNVYRYFESREHVLLALFVEEFEDFSHAVTAQIDRAPRNDITAISNAIAEGFIARPRLCKLVSIFGTVLEQNVSAETIESIKVVLGEQTEPLIGALSRRLPNATIEGCSWAFAMLTSLLAGMWPGVSPSPAAAQVMAKPEFSALTLTLGRDFKRAVAALLSELTVPQISAETTVP